MIHYKEHLHKINTFIFDYDGVMTNGKVIFLSQQEQLRTGCVKDGYAIQFAAREGYKIAVITGGRSSLIKDRLNEIGISDVFLGTYDKLSVFNDYLAENNLHPDNVLFMGDDIPDYEVMMHCGLPTCPADAAEEIKKISKYISPFKGGEGCVRDVIEQVMKIHGKWMNKNAFTW